MLRRRLCRGTALVAVLSATAGPANAQSAPDPQVELRVSSPYVTAGSPVTVRVRSSAAGDIRVQQARQDRRGGWRPSCYDGSPSYDGFIGATDWDDQEQWVIPYAVAGEWVSLRIPGEQFLFFGPELSSQTWRNLFPQGPDSCSDPLTQYTRLVASQSPATGRWTYTKRALTRLW